MRLTADALSNRPNRFDDFAYYEIIIDKIERNVAQNPDIAIETCKSLIEGISKSVLEHTNRCHRGKSRSSEDVTKLYKMAISALAEECAEIEEVFTKGFSSFVHQLGTVRNERGDISHGKPAPKHISSSIQFSKFVAHVTDGLIAFILFELYSLDFSLVDPMKYDDNQEFNNFLDETYPIEGSLSFSKALFEQDEISYKNQLEDYLDDIAD